MFDKSCKNLLVRGVNWIGDAVMILPALRSLKTASTEAKISLLVKSWVSPVFENNPNIDEIIIYEDKYNGIVGKIKLSRMLHKKHFCGAILLQNAFDAALITFLAGIKDRAGYNRDSRGFLLTTPVPLPQNEKKEHQIYYYLELLNHLGIKAEYSYPYIYLTLYERLQAREMLKDLKKPMLGINPGATYGSAKRWFPERFAEIATWFIKDTGGSVVIFGGKTETGIAEDICNHLKIERSRSYEIGKIKGKETYLLDLPPSNLLNLSGRTSLRELISLISECDVFVTNDSGPMHIAYAVRAPIVAIFGSTDPVLTGPPPGMDGNSNVVIPNIPCSPCFERTCKNNDMKCMYAITSDDVYYGIKNVLPNKPAVFFDRDGTLCKDTGYLNKYDNFHVFPEIANVKLLKEKGFKLIGITNQSGVARGSVDDGFVKEISNIFIEKYGFDDFYYCPHHPDEHCPCRKPEPEMLLRARAKHKINFKKSYVIGDKETDMLLAKVVGAKCILVQTGSAKESLYADFIAKDLKEAVDFVIRDSNNIQ